MENQNSKLMIFHGFLYSTHKQQHFLKVKESNLMLLRDTYYTSKNFVFRFQ